MTPDPLEPTDVYGSPAYDYERDEAIDQRTDEIIAEWMDDVEKVAEALDEIAGASDGNGAYTFFSFDLATALEYRDGPQSYFDRLREKVEAHFRRDASTQAEAEFAKEDDNAP